MRVLICGGREFKDEGFVARWLTERFFHSDGKIVTAVIHGFARGVDAFADTWAVLNYISVETYPARWDEHGKAAGPIRNQQMLDEGKPDLVIAFPGGTGTADMVAKARKAGIPVEEVAYMGLKTWPTN